MLYDIGFLIFSIFYLPTLIFKGKLHRDFLERFGVYDEAKLNSLASREDKIWVQAVSVGEVALCKSLIPALKEKFPSHQIVLSTITKAGNDLAKKIFSINSTIIYFPLDFSLVVRKVMNLIKPKLYIMVETEIWPNVIMELSRDEVPSILINGRISDRSFGKYKLAKPFLGNILNRISLFCMQSETDVERIISLGAPPSKVRITGNMKFDIETAQDKDGSNKMREFLGLKEGEELLVAGSTHRGEEEIIVEVFKELVKEFSQLRLVIAPRHIERVSEIERIVKQSGFEPVRVSALKLSTINYQLSTIFVLDTVGQLNDVYSIATLVFVGGSLVKYGGHNPIEPAVFEKAILFGPYMFNFRNIANIFLKNKASIRVLNKKDLFERCRALLKDSEERAILGRNAKGIVSYNRGATERNLDAMREIFG